MEQAVQKTIGWTWFVTAILCQCTAQARALADPHREQADVYAAGSGQLLYRETHWVLPGPTPERWVVYRCPDGQAFARKHVRAAERPAAPNFAFEDVRDGSAEGVRGAPRARTAYLRESKRAEKTREIQILADGVIDAGFDEAVRANWDLLMRGDAVRMQFLIPSRLRFYPVRVQRIESVDWNGLRAERLRMWLDRWFGFAAPEVTLVYAHDDRRLLEFAGTGNVRDARGRNPQVRIVFEAAPQAAALDEAQAVQRLPLTGRCHF